MTVVRDIMTADPTCVRASDTVHDAAVMMAAKSIGALPICGEDNRLKGMVTDRDIVVKVLAEGKDTRAMHAGELADGALVLVDANDDVDAAMRKMAEHKVRRLPVLDGHQLVGIVAQADIARALSDQKVGDLVQALSVD